MNQEIAEEALTFVSTHKLVKDVSQESAKEALPRVSTQKHAKAASLETAREGLLFASILKLVMLVSPMNARGVSKLA